MSITLFAGCSYTAGSGWDDEKDDQHLWTNILHKNNLYLSKTQQINVAEGGSSNSDIFLSASQALFNYRPQYALIQWTDYPRYSVLLSLELYYSTQKFIVNSPCQTHKLNDVTYSEQYLKNIRDRFLSLHHPHRDILNIVKYVNVLINIAKSTNTQIFFLNGCCLWDENFFTKILASFPSEFTEYTQNLLNCKTRDDEEIFKLYNLIHNDYSSAGGINEQYWLNLYPSMYDQRVDSNSDFMHPGKQSNQNYAELFSQKLNQLIKQ